MNYALKNRVDKLKQILPSEDILVFEFGSEDGKKFACAYADGVADKNMIGELIIKPLRAAEVKDGNELAHLLANPDVKECKTIKEGADAVSDGNALLMMDGEKQMFIIGVKNPPQRAVAEPPTQINVKGPREGFTEDVKTNLGLVRKRIKSENFKVKTITVGKQSKTAIAICYIDGVCADGIVEKIEERIKSQEIDIVPDSSYIAAFLSKKPRSLFKRNATSEKPDVFCAKICEGRVGIIVDGSPIALTVPYMVVEDFQESEDYFVVNYRAMIIRVLRVAAVVIGIMLPAVYICAQLFKIQLIPAKLLFKIASSVEGIPLSPSVEIFFTLFVLEVLNEASIRMPKYVGLALSVVGALVLGDTAVKAGIISTPAVIIIAFSAICLYTVPDFVETSTTLRLLYLIVAGSLGMYGLVVLSAYLLCYLCGEQDYGVPLMAPYSPLIARDMRDGIYKANVYDLAKRPEVMRLKNKTRLKKQ